MLPGWLQRQFAKATRDFNALPVWLRNSYTMEAPMDPNAVWLRMINLANTIAHLEDEQPVDFEDRILEAAGQLADAVRAMNDWLSHQGALPAAWVGGR